MEYMLNGGKNVATDSNEAATVFAEELSAAKDGPGTATQWEQHGPGEKHVHAERFELDKNGNPKRFKGHVFFSPELFENIGDLLIPGLMIPNFLLHPNTCGDDGA
jgi:hypothetical protein